MSISETDFEDFLHDARLDRARAGGFTRRLLLSAGGVLLLGGCASQAKSAAVGVPGGATVPRSRSGGATSSGAAPSTAPGDSHTGGAPSSDATLPSTSASNTGPSNANPSNPHSSTTAPPAGPTGNSPTGNGPTGNDPAPPPGKPQYRVQEGAKAIALTIDDGPSPKYTPQVLEVLAQYKIPATFFMIGGNAAKNASLVAEVQAAGHLVGNHTYTHPDLSKMSAASVRAQIERTTDALVKAGARPPALFRAPYGAWSPTVFDVCRDSGLRPVDWSVDPRDWSRPGTDHIVSTVLGQAHTGAIILDHDGGGDRSQTVAALHRYLPKLLAAGYRFVQP